MEIKTNMVHGIEHHVSIKTKSGLEIELFGRNESVSICVEKQCFDVSVNEGRLILDGWDIRNLITKAAMSKDIKSFVG